MSNIEITNLTFGYSADLLFDAANINVDDSWRLGLVGRNGRGKTTLLKLLLGQIDTEISVKSDKNFVYFPQKIKNPSNLTMFELQNLANFEQWELERELTLLNVNLDVLWRNFDSLSGGEQTKCLLAILFLEQSNFPLIDEPTNHLDLESRQIVANYLTKKSGFIVVSHDRNFLDLTTNHILAIERNDLQLYQGNFSVYEQEKNLRDAHETAENEKLKSSISRLKQTALEKRDWSNQRENVVGATFVDKKVAKKQNQRAKSMEKRLDKAVSDKKKLLKNIEKIDDLTILNEKSHHKTLVKFDNVSLEFDDKLFEPIKFDVNQGEILAITGANGTGKSSLLKALTGNFAGEISGQIEIPQNLKISAVSQIYERSGNLRDFAVTEKLDVETFLSNLRKLGMERKTFDVPIEKMSQGQQKKIELAKSLSQPANLYIWDEPLNYLDVFNHEQIVKLIQNFKPTMIIVEHNQDFIKKVATESVGL